MRKRRVAFFVDGYNLYHSFSEKLSARCKWLDLWSLCGRFIRGSEVLQDVHYFTAVAGHRSMESQIRHRKYIHALESTGVRVYEGYFKEKYVVRRREGVFVRLRLYEEKRSDVHLGAQLVSEAYESNVEVAKVMSADGDMSSAIEIVQRHCPHIHVVLVLPLGGKSKELSRLVTDRVRIQRHDIQESLFPDPLVLPSGRHLHRPAEWS